MNSLIEMLNGWGENVLNFAWPMFWQSSLLIAVLFGLDLLFRRKLRAGIRYALWLVVLVKLCLPPTLAIPTSPAWWLHRNPSPAVAKPLPHYTVTYDTSPLPEMPPASLPAYVSPEPAMSFAAWLLVISVTVSLLLLGWMLLRWRQISRQVACAETSGRLARLLDETQRTLDVNTPTVAKQTTNAMSPAVCGLFRPAILIPRALVEHFSDEQMRAVLLHELIHLRRRDVWVNLLQALLQIFYWWHPLVWLANARIRRVREEAVDDAVMLALREEAECYAPTLLEVAKLALDRPLVSLGLVGIMESRHALRQRIERLVDFRAPRHAGLTLVSLLGIVTFTAVAVPMGEGPMPVEKKTLSVVAATTPSAVMNKTNTPQILVTAHFFRMSGIDFQNMFSGWQFKRGPENEGSWVAAWPQPFSNILSRLNASELEQISAPRAVTISGNPVMMSIGNGTNEIKFDCTPVVTNGGVNLTLFYRVVAPQAGTLVTNQFHAVTLLQNQGGIVATSGDENGKAASNLVTVVSVEIVTNTARFQQRLQSVIKRADGSFTNTTPSQRIILEKINHIGFQSIAYDGLPLSEVLRQLAEKTRQADPEHKGINFMINPNADQSGPAMASMINGKIIGGAALDVGQFTVKLNLADVRLTNVLAAIVDVAQNPNPSDPRKIQYAIKDYGIVFQPKTAESPQLLTRAFKVDTNFFLPHLRREAKAEDFSSATNFASAVSKAARTVFTNIGVNLNEPPGKAVFFNTKHSELLVRATEKDLDVIEKTIFKLVQTTLQIHIKARFVEVPKGTLDGMKKLVGTTITNASAGGFTGIVNDVNFRTMLQTLEAKKDFENLGEPEVTTTSGRQTQMRATEIQTIVTNVVFQETATNYGPVPQMTTVETGPRLDVVPYVLADGYTINLTLLPSLTEFLGYEKSTNTTTAQNRAGDKIELPKILPRFATRQVAANVNLWDNQTVVLGGLSLTNVYVSKNKVPVLGDIQVISHLFRSPHKSAVEQEVLVFITATIVDPAGNRVHSDDDLRFAQKGVPEQPQRN